MSTAGLYMLIAVSVAVIAFVVWPLLFSTNRTLSMEELASPLTEEYQGTLDALRALDFDFQTGKILEEDHRLQRAQLVARGAELLRILDQSPVAPSKTKTKNRK
jgi:hypothetical protein